MDWFQNATEHIRGWRQYAPRPSLSCVTIAILLTSLQDLTCLSLATGRTCCEVWQTYDQDQYLLPHELFLTHEPHTITITLLPETTNISPRNHSGHTDTKHYHTRDFVLTLTLRVALRFTSATTTVIPEYDTISAALAITHPSLYNMDSVKQFFNICYLPAPHSWERHTCNDP